MAKQRPRLYALSRAFDTHGTVYAEEPLARLAAYREAGGDAVHADVFAAHYLLANGDAEAAALCGERAFRARPIEHAAWQVLARAYMAQGRYADALVMQAYTAKLLERPLTAEGIPPEVFTDELLDRLSVAMGKAGYAPIAVSRMSYSAEQRLTAESTSFMGEFLPQSTSDLPPYYEGVERTIRHLEGLRDTDHFIFLHTSDVHSWPYPLFQITSSVQARLPLAARLSGAAGSEPSPYLRRTDLSMEVCRQGIRDLDRALGALYRYLGEHYSPEEYLVNIYSDHGVPVFSEHHYIVSPDLTHAAWMMRGAGVPEGVHTDELTSTVDLYPVLGALCGFPVSDEVDGVLPRVFGGTGRDLVFSNSLYPTKPYVLAARSKEHTLCLETQGTVGMDGTVDLAHANVTIYPRAHENEADYAVGSPELRAFFYPRVREFLHGIGNNGELFPLPTKG